jgi:hypothetical protein
MSKSKSPALLALTASALAALGHGGRAQAQDEVAPRADYRFSFYKEAALPADKVTSGTGERYEIQTHQFRFAQPFGADNTLGAELGFEAMSGASPMYVMPDASGRPVDVMSGASIEDQRTDVLLSLQRRQGRATGTLAAGYSGEKDYQAVNGSVAAELETDDRLNTISLGAGYSSDTIEPTQGQWPTGTLHDKRSATTAFVGYSRVLGAQTAVQTTFSYTFHEGYLSDPYKRAWIVSAANTVPDQRPIERSQFAWLARLRQFFKGVDAALHFDYRYYHDNWQVDAHTADLAWHQNLGHGLRLVPGLRYYSQSQAYFYDPYYASARADGLASSDYRLSPYGAIDASLTASWDFAGDWNTSLRYERYDSSADYALGQVVVENPGLVDFQVVSFGLKKTF